MLCSLLPTPPFLQHAHCKDLWPGTLPAPLCRLMFLASTSAGVSSDICTAKSARKTKKVRKKPGKDGQL